MKITLKPGEKIEIDFHHTDGSITVAFGHEDIVVRADLPDAHGRGGPGHYTIYHEPFNNPLPVREDRSKPKHRGEY